MALLDPEANSTDVLVVGDGNFSFSVCLASALAKKSVKIIATSLDSRAAIENNPFAVKNIETLSSFENVEISHEVDATNLGKTFGSRTFSRIIFNFPHTGGKSNIAKSRKLLEQFFASAARHIKRHKGDICVSLCQGQGGTPLDNPRRNIGNTWQVVYQAAKSDLILNAVHPFRSSDYPHYRSAGFRGHLDKSFLTVNGLTHVFVNGVSLETIPDLRSFIATHNSALRKHCQACLHLSPGHPVRILTKKLHHFLTSLTAVGPFTIYNQSDHGTSKIGNLTNDLCVENRALVGANITSTLRQRMLDHYLQGICGSFITSGIELDFTLPPSSHSQPVCHKMLIVKTLMEKTTVVQVKAEVNVVIEAFIQKFCSNFEALRIEYVGEVMLQESVQTDFSVVKSETFELKQGRQVKFHNVRNARSAGIKCSCQEDARDNQEKCIYCRLEHHYLGHSVSPAGHVTSFIQPQTEINLYHQGTLMLTAGLIDFSSFDTDTATRSGWMMEINLDYLAMAMLKIPDIRLLSSSDLKVKEQFTVAFGAKEGHGIEHLKEFVPFSLFPPTYIHDISFWITDGMTEQQFFQDIYETTQGCISDVWFIERYHDFQQDRVSYNYRMVYSSCDKPLTHVQTVKMQNLLRRKLLDCSFNLK